jgi:hypothetical protein
MPPPSVCNSSVYCLCIGEIGGCFDFRQRDFRSVKSEIKFPGDAVAPTLQGVFVTISSFQLCLPQKTTRIGRKQTDNLNALEHLNPLL